ncbi:hypothetical protein LXL04_023332 [Taraxacum kok-saghyz]
MKNREYLKESRVNLKWTQQSQRVGDYAEKSEFGVSVAARWCYELIEWGKHIGNNSPADLNPNRFPSNSSWHLLLKSGGISPSLVDLQGRTRDCRSLILDLYSFTVTPTNLADTSSRCYFTC